MSYAFFYKSVNGDRVYDDTSFEHWLKKFFTSGVFLNDLHVTTNGGMSVNVGTGYVNADGKVKNFESDTTLSIETAGATYPRIDSVVLERNDTERDIILKVVKGGYSSNPVAHVPVRQNGVYQLVIAQIYVAAGAVKITQTNITDTRSDKELCGIVTGAVNQIDFSQIQAQFDAYMETYKEYIADYAEQMQADFDVWFDNVKGQLSEDVAGNLQLQINETNRAVKNNAEFLEKLKAVPVNNNILINSNFANPVNQRGSLSVLPSVGAYTLDRWKASNISLILNNGYITAKSYDGSKLKLLQIIEFPTLYSDKTLTATLKYRVRGFDNSTDAQLQVEADGVVASTANLVCDEMWHVAETTSKLGTVSSELRYSLIVTGNGEIDIEWAKLEEGEYATPYVPRLYAEELELCKRYYQKIHSSRAFPIYGVSSDFIRFTVPMYVWMRIAPTVTINGVGVSKNGEAATTGFNFELHESTFAYVQMKASKSSHGLTYHDCLSVVAEFSLDAEL